jgi:rsbT co-antagonist protein RsbR
MSDHAQLAALLREERDDILEGWLSELTQEVSQRAEDLREDAERILDLVIATVERPSREWASATDDLPELARSRVASGFATDETVIMVSTLRACLLTKASRLDDTELLRSLSRLLDLFLTHLVDAFVEARELVIARQREDLLELSTPAIQLWDGILAVPLVGTLDSRRAVSVMETLLARIASTQANIAIIDVTGVPTVDTLVAQHILRTVSAARLTGARCILCGIRPQIAQTMIELGIELSAVETRANLADAFAAALESKGLRVEASHD